MKHIILKSAFMLFILAFLSCGTLINAGKANVSLTAKNQDGTTVLVNGLEKGVTPLTIKVKADDIITFEKDGFERRQVIVDSKFNTITILNLFSILGWGIDAISGSLKIPDTRVYTITLKEN